MSSRFPMRAMEHGGKDPCPIPCSVPRVGGGQQGGNSQVWEGVLITSLAGGMEDWKDRKSQGVVRVRPYGLVLWVSQL